MNNRAGDDSTAERGSTRCSEQSAGRVRSRHVCTGACPLPVGDTPLSSYTCSAGDSAAPALTFDHTLARTETTSWPEALASAKPQQQQQQQRRYKQRAREKAFQHQRGRCVPGSHVPLLPPRHALPGAEGLRAPVGQARDRGPVPRPCRPGPGPAHAAGTATSSFTKDKEEGLSCGWQPMSVPPETVASEVTVLTAGNGPGQAGNPGVLPRQPPGWGDREAWGRELPDPARAADAGTPASGRELSART